MIKTEIVEVPVAAPQASNSCNRQLHQHQYASISSAAASRRANSTSDYFVTAQMTVDESSLQSFFNAQQQAAEVHQQFLAIPQHYGDTFNTLMSEQAKMATAGVAIPREPTTFYGDVPSARKLRR